MADLTDTSQEPPMFIIDSYGSSQFPQSSLTSTSAMSLPSNALTITEISLEKRRRHADFMKSSQDPHLQVIRAI
jgi:hypothetical protein